ncbi:hypothetical protein CI088_10945 [Enterococcus plantarum]|uniref:DNA gyrase subunit A n=1 Tax=Enterococcus plantarum TaxID=1077675 RepID=A0A2W4BG23_9ENTE|nr:hypothetical protein [Enterococcus plantarum]PZL72122.1 hypothetical protein CI088_10945 [Enterococcus plantarum]
MDSVFQTGRATLGVRLTRMEEDAKVVTMAVVEPEPDEIVEEIEGVETTVVESETPETDPTTEE